MEPAANLTEIFFAVEARAKAVNPDKAPSQRRIAEYPLQIWYLLLSFLALVTICHFTARLLARTSISAGTRGPSRLIRLPLAVAHVFRTLAFRTTASFAGYTLNLAEFFLGCGYIAVIFTWALINSEQCPSFTRSSLTRDAISDRSRGTPLLTKIFRRPLWLNCRNAIPIADCSRNEEQYYLA